MMQKVFGFLLYAPLAIVLGAMLVHWFQNPALSQMQIFLEFKWWYAGMVLWSVMVATVWGRSDLR